MNVAIWASPPGLLPAGCFELGTQRALEDLVPTSVPEAPLHHIEFQLSPANTKNADVAASESELASSVLGGGGSGQGATEAEAPLLHAVYLDYRGSDDLERVAEWEVCRLPIMPDHSDEGVKRCVRHVVSEMRQYLPQSGASTSGEPASDGPADGPELGRGLPIGGLPRAVEQVCGTVCMPVYACVPVCVGQCQCTPGSTSSMLSV